MNSPQYKEMIALSPRPVELNWMFPAID